MTDEKMVRVPEEMFKQLEKRAMKATELELVLAEVARILRPYEIKAVITAPPTGADALEVTAAITALVRLALLEDIRR